MANQKSALSSSGLRRVSKTGCAGGWVCSWFWSDVICLESRGSKSDLKGASLLGRRPPRGCVGYSIDLCDPLVPQCTGRGTRDMGKHLKIPRSRLAPAIFWLRPPSHKFTSKHVHTLTLQAKNTVFQFPWQHYNYSIPAYVRPELRTIHLFICSFMYPSVYFKCLL